MKAIRKNSFDVVLVEEVPWEGGRYVDIRAWAEHAGEEGQPLLMPTRKGGTFKKALLPEVIEALQEVAGRTRVLFRKRMKAKRMACRFRFGYRCVSFVAEPRARECCAMVLRQAWMI